MDDRIDVARDCHQVVGPPSIREPSRGAPRLSYARLTKVSLGLLGVTGHAPGSRARHLDVHYQRKANSWRKRVHPPSIMPIRKALRVVVAHYTAPGYVLMEDDPVVSARRIRYNAPPQM